MNNPVYPDIAADNAATGESVQNDKVNTIGAAGQSTDLDVGKIVSGQPAGGPHDLAKQAHDEAEKSDEQD